MKQSTASYQSIKVFLNKHGVNLIAIGLLSFMLLMAFFSVKDDSLTMDEASHLPAGYSYLTQKDMRINPEHPPLIKELAGFPLLFIRSINFPYDIDGWQKDINGQWNYGFYFLYKMGNPAEKMIFWGRMPMLSVLLLLGIYLFKWTRELFGNRASLLALFLFSFSPTFLAHGRLVTTDVGAATGIFIATYYFIKFLKEKTKKSLIIAGITLGLAELTKFSAILLLPFFGVLIFVWAVSQTAGWRSFLKTFLIYLGYFIAIIAIAYLVVFPFYQYLVLNYPAERQVRDSRFLLSSFAFRPLANLVVWLADKPVLRAYGQYALGLLMVMQRATGGHTTYFLGEVSAAGWKSYFPFVYLVKETLTFHVLTLTALLYSLWRLIERWPNKPFWQNGFRRIFQWSELHLPELAMLVFIGLYWASSINSPLNIGVRHLLPTFPFVMVLVGGTISQLLKPPYLKVKFGFLAILILWQTIAIVRIYPHFLSYFNELIGGPNNAYIYTVDSNLDWGQDLKRLKKWLDDKGIDKIYVDYFGGSDASYYLKEKFLPWQGTHDPKELPKRSYLAVSATFLQGGRGKPAPGFDQPWGYYLWLNKYTPITKIGYSIFVYYIP